MKKSIKQSPNKLNFTTFCNLIALVLCQNDVKGLRVTKNVKKIKVERIWSKLESKQCFQRQ